MSLGWRSVESRAISWKKKVLKFHSEKRRKGCEKRSNFSFNYSNILFTLHTLPPNAIFAACHETPRKNGRRKKTSQWDTLHIARTWRELFSLGFSFKLPLSDEEVWSFHSSSSRVNLISSVSWLLPALIRKNFKFLQHPLKLDCVYIFFTFRRNPSVICMQQR